PVYGYVLRGGWYDVGTPERYLEAMHDLLEGRFSYLLDFEGRIDAKTRVWIQGESLESMKRREEIIKKIKQGKIEVEGSVLIGRHCKIGDGSRLANSCIDNYTRIERGVTIENSAVMDRTIVGNRAEIRDSIIGRHVTINSSFKNPTKISAISVVADDVTIAEGSVLNATKVYPHKHVKGQFENQTI
ncbi:MAG: NDP-sugar synthase, partial [Candidatus Bathyarchaeia archaeon]